MALKLKQVERVISCKWLNAKWTHQPAELSVGKLEQIAKRNDINFMWSKYLKVRKKVFWRKTPGFVQNLTP